MFPKSFTRSLVTAAFATLLGTPSCAAPDAIPAAAEDIAPAGLPQWALGFGESTADQHAFDVALDSSTDTIVSTVGFAGSIIIPGVAGDMPFYSQAGRNFLAVKYAATGSQPLWGTPIYANYDILRSVVDIDFKGNSIVAGGFAGALTIPDLTPLTAVGDYDGYIAKFDPAGIPLWVVQFGDAYTQFVTDVATDGEGNIIVVGMAGGETFAFGPGVDAPKVTDGDIFVAKFDPAGQAIWAKRVGRAGSVASNDPTATVAVSRADGSIIVGGSHGGTLDFPPQQLSAAGAEDGFVVKLDAQGNGLWHMTFGDKDRRQRVTSVAYGSTGEVLLTGWFSGSVSLGGEVLTSYQDSEDLLVAKLNANGKHAWSRGYGHLGVQMGSSVHFDARGNAVVVGSFTGDINLFGNDTLINTAVDSYADVFAAKFNVNGTPGWGRSYGDVYMQIAHGGVLWKDSDGQDRAIIVGANSGTIDVGQGMPSVASQGLEDAFFLSVTH